VTCFFYLSVASHAVIVRIVLLFLHDSAAFLQINCLFDCVSVSVSVSVSGDVDIACLCCG
jgi:hypothetical protein